MEDKDIFRTAIFGGYQKEDVTDYIRSLENENETIRILANKEKSELRIQLEKEKARSEELKHSLASLQDRIAALEKEGKLRESAGEPEASYTSDAKNRTTDEELMRKLREERKEQQQWIEELPGCSRISGKTSNRSFSRNCSNMCSRICLCGCRKRWKSFAVSWKEER